MPAHRHPKTATVNETPDHPTVNLDHYVPGYLTWVSNKLSRGASHAYLRVFGVGIEMWRLMVLLAIEGRLSANEASRIIGMDKASVSRCFKAMHSKGFIEMGLDAQDGRLRIAKFTDEGRSVHDQIIGLALERERAFLSALAPDEAKQFLALLVRLHENLPEVEKATDAYIQQHFSTDGQQCLSDEQENEI